MKPLPLVVLSLVCALGPVAFGQESKTGDESKKYTKDSKAVDILKAADAATKKVDFVRYHASVKGLGPMAQFVPAAEGTVVAKGEWRTSAYKFRVMSEMASPDGEGKVKYTVGSDGDVFYFVDMKSKTAYEDIDPAVIGRTGGRASGIQMVEFNHPAPFSDEINGKAVELRGTESVGGVDCDVVHVVYASAAQEATWYFGKDDHLPRRVIRTRPMGNGVTGETEQVIT